MSSIPVNDLARDMGLEDEILASIKRVMKRGWYVLGEECDSFEKEFAKFCGVQHCVGVANGTDALELALRALDIKAGDKVITVANAGMYSTTAILLVGAVPVFVDVEPETLLISIDELELTIQSNIKAVIVTHLYGRMVNMPAIVEIANRKEVPIIEDCAQAHGASMQARQAGSWGKIGCYSFYPTKNLGAVGDGGAIVTNDSSLSEKIRKLRQYGWEGKYRSTESGGRNSRLDEIQAAVLRVKLPYLVTWNNRRQEIASEYGSRTSHPLIQCPPLPDESNVFHLYVVRAQNRDQLMEHLRNNGVGSDVHYPIPDYRQASVSDKYKSINCINTEEACKHVVTLPCFPGMDAEEVNAVIDVINNWRP